MNFIDRDIGSRLRAYRVSARMNQTDLGKLLGVTFQQIQKYEKGTNRLSGSRFVHACSVLKITPDALLGTKAGEGIDSDLLQTLQDRVVANMVLAIAKLTPKQRVAVSRAMVAMVDAFGKR
jgi:transcriptional regulator with XRE-family HTH domain